MNQANKENMNVGSNFYAKVKKDAQIFQSMDVILEKLEINQNLRKFESLIMEVFQQEIFFTVSCKIKSFKRYEKNSTQSFYTRSFIDEFKHIQRKSKIDIKLYKYYKKQIMFGKANQILIKLPRLQAKYTLLYIKVTYNLLENQMKKISHIFLTMQQKSVAHQICIINKRI